MIGWFKWHKKIFVYKIHVTSHSSFFDSIRVTKYTYSIAMILVSLNSQFSKSNSRLILQSIKICFTILAWELPILLANVVFFGHFSENYPRVNHWKILVKISADLCQKIKLFKLKQNSNQMKIGFNLIPKRHNSSNLIKKWLSYSHLKMDL